MINNFNIISKLILEKALDQGDFFFLQIMKRRKDNPGMYKDMVTIENFFIKDAIDLMDKQDRIIEICNANNARAYIRLNKRSMKKVALETLALVARNIASENYDIKNCYLSCCGQYHSDPNKTWVVDLDGRSDASNIMKYYIEFMCDPKDWNLKIRTTIPTKNGIHLITTPFNLQTFRKRYPDVDVHRDNPTILYCP